MNKDEQLKNEAEVVKRFIGVFKAAGVKEFYCDMFDAFFSKAHCCGGCHAGGGREESTPFTFNVGGVPIHTCCGVMDFLKSMGLITPEDVKKAEED